MRRSAGAIDRGVPEQPALCAVRADLDGRNGDDVVGRRVAEFDVDTADRSGSPVDPFDDSGCGVACTQRDQITRSSVGELDHGSGLTTDGARAAPGGEGGTRCGEDDASNAERPSGEHGRRR